MRFRKKCIKLSCPKKQAKNVRLTYKLFDPRFVAGFPNFRKRNSGMEPVKDAQGQSNTLNDGPGQETVEFQLNRVGLYLLRLKSVYYPHGDIAYQ